MSPFHVKPIGKNRPCKYPMPPFLVYGLPRSRTYWLSRYLTVGEWQCGHDELRHCRSMDDVTSWLAQPCTGSVETAAAPFWRLAKHLKTVTIRRPVDQVVESFMRLGFPVDREVFRRYMLQFDRKLDQIEQRVPNVLSVTFDDLRYEETCKKVFEFCLPYPHDPSWWNLMAPLNLQINMHHLVRYYAAHEAQLTKLAKIAKHQTIAQMNRDLVAVDQDDGLTIQEESLSSAVEAKALFAEHCVLVGESPDSYDTKNWPLMHKLEELGAIQVMTARCNGRLFGYLMALISPSLESPDIQTAIHTTFFASPEFKGLGMKLQRASVEALRAKGIDEVYFHAGPRGMGPRMGTVYRRLGAVEFGNLWKLELEP